MSVVDEDKIESVMMQLEFLYKEKGLDVYKLDSKADMTQREAFKLQVDTIRILGFWKLNKGELKAVLGKMGLKYPKIDISPRNIWRAKKELKKHENMGKTE